MDSCVHILSDLYENGVIDDLLIVLPTVCVFVDLDAKMGEWSEESVHAKGGLFSETGFALIAMICAWFWIARRRAKDIKT